MNTYIHFLGIDCAAESFCSALYRSGDGIVASLARLPMTPEGFTAFEHALIDHHCDRQQTIICIEATGVYSEQICYWLTSRGWTVALESPLKVKRAFHARAKTDRLDAQQIAEYACRFCDQLERWHPNDAIVEQISVLLSTREQLSGQLTASRNALKSVERKYIDTPAARRIYDTMIATLKGHILEIDREIKRLIDDHSTLSGIVAILMTAPGVGLLLAANLAVLTRGFSGALEYRRLASYVGICPYQYQSGSSVHRRARSSGFGPARIRKLLYLASLSLKRNHGEFTRYYAHKVADGKSGRLVINNIANKLLRIICSMIKHQMPYAPSHRSVKPVATPAT